jgi:hypothetical protein
MPQRVEFLPVRSAHRRSKLARIAFSISGLFVGAAGAQTPLSADLRAITSVYIQNHARWARLFATYCNPLNRALNNA